MKISKFGLMIALAVVLSALGGMVFGSDSLGDAIAYFPLKPGNYWVYKLSANSQVFDQKIKVAEPENGKQKVIVYDPNGNPVDFVSYELNQEGLFKSSEMATWGFYEYHPLWPMLKNNMAIGTSWDWESEDHKMKENVKVIGNEKVTVPAGTYDALLIQCAGIDPNGAAYVDKTWYVKDLGYVKDEYTVNDKTMISELTECYVAK